MFNHLSVFFYQRDQLFIAMFWQMPFQGHRKIAQLNWRKTPLKRAPVNFH